MSAPSPETPPELASVEAFAEYLLEDERLDYTAAEAATLAAALHQSVKATRAALEAIGFTLRAPGWPPGRGFLTSSHDRWYGPGSEATHGGSGYEQIAGWAGARG